MITAIVTGFYTQLATYSGTYKAHHIIAPQNASLPYVTFGLETDTPIGIFQNLEAIEDLTFWINCFSTRKLTEVHDIADLVFAVMDDSTLSIDGYTSMVCRREFVGSVMFDLDTKIFQLPLRYRILADKD